MAEKLYRSRCSVPGHGTRCSVARDIYPDKKRLSKLRRQRANNEIRSEVVMKCEHCGEAEAEVEVEIPISENGRKTVKLCVDCATETKEEDRGRAG